MNLKDLLQIMVSALEASAKRGHDFKLVEIKDLLLVDKTIKTTVIFEHDGIKYEGSFQRLEH